ncbi:hypothetical protein [Mycobacteroides abscessus]|uniref:hypothetical protein n=1 Tax=Mycobacteroides abscessus TaxID=36809 RepID=UPI001041CE01|nr:hypothetical protein [Mycobacteroides abscessus]
MRTGTATLIGGGSFMAGARPKAIPERQILVTLPEDKMMRLVKRVSESDMSAHDYAACKLLEAIK